MKQAKLKLPQESLLFPRNLAMRAEMKTKTSSGRCQDYHNGEGKILLQTPNVRELCACVRQNFLFTDALAGAHPLRRALRAVPLKARNRSSPRLKKRLVPACPFTSLLSLPATIEIVPLLADTRTPVLAFVGACSRPASLLEYA